MAGSKARASVWRRAVAVATAGLVMEPAAQWIQHCEKLILRTGEPATAEEQVIARSLGVRHPERVRFLACDDIPVPGRRWARMFGGAIPGRIGGLTARYGIFLYPDLYDSKEVRIHELVHVAQYDRLGTRPFLWHYVRQCVADGYLNSELEREARVLGVELSGGEMMHQA